MTADRARGALAVLQDADGKFICEVPCGYIVEQTASAHKPRRIQAQRRRRAMLRRRVALTVALLTVAALLAALMPWSGSGAADKPKDTTAGTLEEVHQPTAVLLPSSGTVAEYVPNAAEVEALAKLIYGEAGIVPSTTEQAAVVWCVLNRVDDPRFPDTVLEVIEAPYCEHRRLVRSGERDRRAGYYRTDGASSTFQSSRTGLRQEHSFRHGGGYRADHAESTADRAKHYYRIHGTTSKVRIFPAFRRIPTATKSN